MDNTVLNDVVSDVAQVVTTAAENDLGGAFSPERWAYAGQMTLLGMVMIFAVLAILWGVLAIFQRVMASSSEQPAKKPVAAPVPAPVAEAAPVASSSDDEVIAAIISAAVAAYMADEGNTDAAYNGGFRVVSFRRVQGGKAWNSKH